MSNDAVAGLRGTRLASLTDIQQTATLLDRIYRGFVEKNSLSSEELRLISCDAAKRMGRLALQASRYGSVEFLILLARALQLNYRILSPSAILKGFGYRRFLNVAR